MLKICIIGTGYVGLVSGSCLADFGNRVRCIDIDADRIAMLERGEIPIYEPGLGDMVARNRSGGRLTFSTDLAKAVKDSEVIFIAVGTPSLGDGSTDLSYVLKASESIAKHLSGRKVVVQKSTAPVGTTRRLAAKIRELAPAGAEIEMVANPEFLREGSAVEDFLRPNRVIIGVESARGEEIMKRVYRPLYLIETPIVLTGLETAELIKYASNTFLATKISFINEMAAIAERVGADIDDVARGMGLDGRIGRKFLHAGVGFGGSCLPKDVSSLAHLARSHGHEARLVEAVLGINAGLPDRAVDKLETEIGKPRGKTVAVLGLSFKPNTDDVREAPAIRIVERLTRDGAKVRAFDPVAMDKFSAETGLSITPCKDPYDAAQGSDALILVTEWNEFRELDLNRLKDAMKEPVFIDCRNVYKTDRMDAHGFRYQSFGRGRSATSAEGQGGAA